MKKKLSQAHVYLAAVILAVFSAMPFLWLLMTSLRGGDVFGGSGLASLIPQEWTTVYYAKLLAAGEQMPLLRFLGNTVLICAAGVFLEVALSSMAAYPLARMDFPGRNIVFAIMLSTLMLPSQANMIVNFVTIRNLGLFDTLIAVVLPGAVSVFGIFIMRQAFLVVPRDLEDAARLDGCSEWGIFRHVMLPLTRPAQGTLALFAFTAHWNSFMWPLVVLKSSDLYPISVGLSYMAQTFDSDFRMTAAGLTLATLPIIAVFLLIQKQFIRGITAGAVK